jgi:AraC-like DNA-binding protein
MTDRLPDRYNETESLFSGRKACCRMNRTVLWFSKGELAQATSWEINGLGVNDPMDAGLVDRTSGTGDYLFMYFSTACEIYINGKLGLYPANTFILWSPGNRHTFGHSRQDWNHHWIHCNGTTIQSILNSSKIPFNQPILNTHSQSHIKALSALYDEVFSNEKPDWIIMESIFSIWIREIERQISAEFVRRLPGRLLLVKRFIESNFNQAIPLEQMAALSNLSISQFSAQFKNHIGTSPISYLQQVRLHRAMHLLSDRNLTIEQVAQKIGMSDPFYFTRQFKKHFGISPSRFREQDSHAVPLE